MQGLLTTMKLRSVGQTYRTGGRLYYRNNYGQGLYGVILGFIESNGRQLICVQRDCWPSPEFINLDDYVQSRYFPPTKA